MCLAGLHPLRDTCAGLLWCEAPLGSEALAAPTALGAVMCRCHITVYGSHMTIVLSMNSCMAWLHDPACRVLLQQMQTWVRARQPHHESQSLWHPQSGVCSLLVYMAAMGGSPIRRCVRPIKLLNQYCNNLLHPCAHSNNQ